MNSIKIIGIKNFKYDNMTQNKSFHTCVILLNFFLKIFIRKRKNGKNDEIVQLLKLLEYSCIKYILTIDHVNRWSLFIVIFGCSYF